MQNKVPKYFLSHNPSKCKKHRSVIETDKWKESSLRVAIYCRTPIDDSSAFSLQREQYKKWLEQYPHWTLADFYTEHDRETCGEFNRMTGDAEAGKLDLIIVKSLSTFRRNIVDCVSAIRTLLRLQPPVGVYFESENFCSLSQGSKYLLPAMMELAVEESNRKNETL